MNKILKLALATSISTMILITAGCGDDKKPEPAKPAQKPAATATKPDANKSKFANLLKTANNPTPENKNPNAPKPLSPLYVYRPMVKGPEDIYPITPQVLAAFEKEAKKFKLGEGKKWVYSVNVSKRTDVKKPNPYGQVWIGVLPGHHAKTFTHQGKEYIEEHLAYISMRVNTDTEEIRVIESFRTDVDATTGPSGKKTYTTQWKKAN